MTSVDQFYKKVLRFKNGFKLPHTIAGGRDGYLVVEINDTDVVILQNKTRQKHKIHRLRDLFVNGGFTGPQNGKYYDRKSKFGHLRMKNAVVYFLEKL